MTLDMPYVIRARCDGCGLCIEVCGYKTLALVNGIATVLPTGECDWCTECEAVCPTRAITCPFEIVFEHK